MSNLIKTNSTSISTTGSRIITQHQYEPYSQRLSRENKGCFVFMIDQSGSMAESWGVDDSKTKADMVAYYVNEALHEIINICQKTEADPRHYFDICVMGYGQDTLQANILWEGSLAGKTFVSPADLKQNPTGISGEIEIEKVVWGKATKQKIPLSFWFSPIAESMTPMGAAFDLCEATLKKWCAENPISFPPVVINITDGMQSDCENKDLLIKAQKVKETGPAYGTSLLFNFHLSEDAGSPLIFPSSENELPDDEYCHLLFNMSSELPEVFRKRIAIEIKNEDYSASKNYIGLTYQANVAALVKSMNIGTRTLNV